MDELASMRLAVTDSVRLWLAGDDDENPGAFQFQRYGRKEAKEIAAQAFDEDDAAAVLRSWFTDRLTVDPGIPGPFGGLGFDLLGCALDLVDWELLARWLRSDAKA